MLNAPALPSIGFSNAIYFDTFPDAVGLDPVNECGTTITAVEGMMRMVDKLRGNQQLAAAIERQDAVASQRILQSVLFPAP